MPNHGSSPWSRAMVTGASSGIGAAFARALAAEGVDLVLVGRRASALEALGRELSVPIEIILADLTCVDDLARVVERVGSDHEPVDLLVNAAGVGQRGRFCSVEVGAHREQVSVNVTAVVDLTFAAARRMEREGRGTIVQVSSTAATGPGHGHAVYAASKAFVSSLSGALREELAPSGVRICTVVPGPTRTDFHRRAGYDVTTSSGPLWQDPAEVVAEALDGIRSGRSVIVTGRMNRVAGSLRRILPEGAVRALAHGRNHAIHLGERGVHRATRRRR